MKQNKKLIFIYIIFTFSFVVFCQNNFIPDLLYNSHLVLLTNFGIDYNCLDDVQLHSEIQKNENSSNINFPPVKFGGDLKLPFLEIKTYLKTQNNLNLAKSINSWKNKEDFIYGVSAFSDNYLKDFPCQIKYGNLSCGGSFSKLNNPLLTDTASPFSKVTPKANYITNTLPGLTSFSKQESFFLQTGYINKKKILQELKFNLWSSPQEEITAFSFFCTIHAAKKIYLNLSASTSNSFFKENESSQWFLQNNFYYHQGVHNSTNLQGSLNTNIYNGLFSFYCFESPFGNFKWIYKTENILKLNRYLINFSMLYNPNDYVLTNNQQKIDSCIQFKSGIQNKKNLLFSISQTPIFIKTGVNTYLNINPNKKKNELKTGLGIQAVFPPTTFSINAIFSADIKNSNGEISYYLKNQTYQISNNWNNLKLSPVFNAQISFSSKEDSDTKSISQKYAVNLLLSKKPKITGTSSFYCKIKQGEIDNWNETSALSFVFTTKYITYNFKISIVFFRG